MILPALSSGYCKSSLICLRVSSSVTIKSLSTTFAGISSSTSTVSSRYISSITSLISESVKALISTSRMSLLRYVKVSAADSFDKRRNTMIRCFSSNSSSNSAKSTGYIFSNSIFNSLYSLFSSISKICSSFINNYLQSPNAIFSLTFFHSFCQIK